MQYHVLAAAAVALLTAPALAQNPADDCSGAIPVTLGVNAGLDNTGATPSTPSWVCTTTTTNDIWMSFTAASTGVHVVSTCNSAGTLNDTLLEVLGGSCGALTSIACNDDACSLKSEVSFFANSGVTYYIRAAGFGGATGTIDVEITVDGGFGVVGTAEATPGANLLGLDGGTFEGGWDLRWNYVDAAGTFNGKFAVMTMQVELGGAVPVASTAAIPGLVQAWPGSMPAGPDPLFFGPAIVGQPDGSVTVPPGLFASGDSVRIQGVVLDPATATGTLPVVASDNTIEWNYFALLTCTVIEDFETTAIDALPAGWVNQSPGSSTWETHTGPTNSSNTGPAGAGNGVNYLYCETSGSGGSANFVCDTAPVASASLPNGTLSFRLSRIGATIGSLDILMDDGTGTFVLLANYTGASASGLDWDVESIDLLTASGLGSLPANIVIRLDYTGGGSFTGDVAIDDFCLN